MAQNSAMIGDDSRLKKSAAESVRGARDGADDSRVNRDGTALSAQERRRMLRQEMVQEVLPTPPQIEGFHTCWLTTTNSVDPIFKRLRQGYVLVRQSEVAGFEQFSVKGGEFDGCVACNEMLLAKVPNELYHDLMAIYHHDMPAEQEETIFEQIKQFESAEQDSDGKKVVSSEGYENMGPNNRPRNPTFA